MALSLLRPLRTSLLVAASVSVLSMGCEDKQKVSAQRASADVAALAKVCDTDVSEVSRGLPLGAKKLSRLYDKGSDPTHDRPQVQRALKQIRREVPDLDHAKSTFFALADDHGIAIRNNMEEDTMAGRSLIEAFPEISKAIAGAYVQTSGAFPGVIATYGPDKDWVAAIPVNKEDGSVGGVLVTGWSYRYFARHLFTVLQSRLVDIVKSAGGNEDKLPVFYVAVFDSSGVYSAPLTPTINEQVLTDAHLVDKTANGPYQAGVNITGREFGYAAVRIPSLGPSFGIVVLRSEL